MALYFIRVKPEYPWTTARVSGRIFSKHGEVLNGELVNDEILNSSLLLVEPQDAEPATVSAETPADNPTGEIPEGAESGEGEGESKIVEPETIAVLAEPSEEEKPKRRGGK